MRTRGSFNLGGTLAITALVVGIYFVVMLAPAYTDNMDVQQAVNAAVNNSTRSDQYLRNDIRDKLRNVGSHKEDDGFGNLQVVPGLGFTDDDIMIDRDDVRNTVSVYIDYSRDVELKPFHKILTLHFHPSKSGPAK